MVGGERRLVISALGVGRGGEGDKRMIGKGEKRSALRYAIIEM